MTKTEQVACGILELIGAKQLRVGDKLPTMRDIAHAHEVSVFVASEAARYLEQHGIVEARVGDGTYVTDASPALLRGVQDGLRQAAPVPRVRGITVSAARQPVRTGLVAVLISETSSAFYGGYLRGILRNLERQGYGLLLSLTGPTGDFEDREVRRYMEDPAVRGFIIQTLHKRVVPEYLPELRERKLPVVLVGDQSFAGKTGYDRVSCDTGAGTAALMDYVLSQGHERVLYAEYAAFEPVDNHLRRETYRRVLTERGLEARSPLRLSHLCKADRVEALRDALSGDMRAPTALVCFNDRLALWAVQALRQLGKRIPEDVSVCGFDDREGMDLMNPPLTTVRWPREQAGEEAALVLTEKIAGRIALDDDRHLVLAPELIVRQSCGPAPVGAQ